MKGAYFWLTVFFVVYCARPEDWIPGLHSVPLAKISGVFAIIGLLLSVGRSRRGLRDFPREALYLLLMIGIFFLSAAFSPVWKGGAFFRTLDFSKVFVAWVLTFLAVTSLARLRRVLFIQAASVAVISIVSMVKGASHPRLDGVLGGIYSNPNDLGFAIVLSLPFCLAFLLRTGSILRKSAWTVSLLLMISALFLTASRGAFITFLVAGAASLWHFGIKGRRLYLIGAALLIAIVVGIAVGGPLKDRLLAVSGEGLDTDSQSSAYGSYEQRRILISRSLDGIEHYPVLGIGLHNFSTYSGVWRDVHVTYLQIAVEGGILCLILYLLFLGARIFQSQSTKARHRRRPRSEIVCRGLAQFTSRLFSRRLVRPGGLSIFPVFRSRLHSGSARNRTGGGIVTRIESTTASGRRGRARSKTHFHLCLVI